MSTVRVRFAPSPTGYLHVGGLRTALYNYLFARKNKGVLIVRIEDTDRGRYVEGAVENLIETLRWAGLEYDEGPVKGGAAAPYVQSERIDLYKKYADELVQQGKAYRAFDSAEELEEMRRELEKRRLPLKYDRRALKLSAADVQRKLAAGEPSVVRLKVPDATTIVVDDVVRGRVEFSSDLLDDQVLLKSDGYPTYHLANVVDDHLMGITHVIRGEEWLPSTPKHVVLYEYFGWDKPVFAHLPLLLNPDKSKLSKRQGDVAVEDYRKKGYLPEALVNFVAFLGWNPGDERELFTLEELVSEFSLERVGKAGAVFNIEKLNWLNAQYLRKKPDAGVLEMLRAYLQASGLSPVRSDDGYLLRVIGVMRERATFVSDFVDKCPYFYRNDYPFDPDVVRKRWKPEAAAYLERFVEKISGVSELGNDAYEAALQEAAGSLSLKTGDLIHPLRLAVTGMGVGPGLYDILSIIGRDEVVRRIRAAIDKLSQKP